MTADEIMEHHKVKLEEKLAQDQADNLLEELKERKSGETGSY